MYSGAPGTYIIGNMEEYGNPLGGDLVDEIIRINYEAENPTVSARELYEGLEIKSNFSTWLERMTEYGFFEGSDFSVKWSDSKNGNAVTYEKSPQYMSAKGYEMDADISVDMAKQICMIQRTEKGRQYRQYFLDLEKAWNTPEQIFARALKLADKEIERLKSDKTILIEDVKRMRPKEVFADAVSASHTSILVGDLAKLLKQNEVDIGANRLFEWLRNNGYLIKRRGSDWNMPTQYSMKMNLFEIKESSHLNGNGCNVTTKTPKVTGIGQQYFINKFLGEKKKEG